MSQTTLNLSDLAKLAVDLLRFHAQASSDVHVIKTTQARTPDAHMHITVHLQKILILQVTFLRRSVFSDVSLTHFYTEPKQKVGANFSIKTV